MPDFVPGLVLAERFYREAVRPILDANFPGLAHSAGLIGRGSEVLGFDTPVSSDHHWGPRALLFLGEDDHAEYAESVREELRRRLPHSFLGWPTNFAEPKPDDPGTQLLHATTSGPVNHRVDVLTLRGFFFEYLGLDLRDPLDPLDWLTFPSQKLRAISAGAIFHDAIGLDGRHRSVVGFDRRARGGSAAGASESSLSPHRLIGRSPDATRRVRDPPMRAAPRASAGRNANVRRPRERA